MTINGILKIVAGIGLAITLAIFAFSGTTIKPGEEGFLFDSFGGGINKTMIYSEGYTAYLPWKEMITYNVQYKSHKYSAKVLDKDGTEVTVSVTVELLVEPSIIFVILKEVTVCKLALEEGMASFKVVVLLLLSLSKE